VPGTVPANSSKTQPVATARKAAPRLRDGAQTRAVLLAAARAEFAAKGFAGTRVDEIAQVAGVNKQVIYHHFGNKDGLFRTTLEAGYEQVRKTNLSYVESTKPLPPADAVRQLAEHMFDRFLKHTEMVELVLEENRQKGKHLIRKELIAEANRPLIDHIAKVLRQGETDGSFFPGNDARQFFFDMVSLCMFYFANVHTMSAALAHNLASPASARARRAHIVQTLLRSLGVAAKADPPRR
jgi:TetR/AcrR family transcriptional regulator